MKTVVIGDIHGRDCWKGIVANEAPDRVIFIGDYFDSYDNYTAAEQIHNFQEIIDWKKSGQCGVAMLIGNHDYHYMRGITEHYSGYQIGARAAIEQLLDDNKEHLQMCYQMGIFVFSHAGISADWLNNNGWKGEYISDFVNDMWQYKPNTFKFTGRDPYGDSKESSPIWIRPKSLQNSNYDVLRSHYIQVVGHTQQNQIDRKGKSTGGRYYYIDTLGTSGEYMIIDDGDIKFNTYKNETATA
jgi:predicted MPP superfamily phosphohydrolase